MNFDLDDDQQTIKRTAREFLSARYKAEEVRRLALEDERGFTDEQWAEIAGLGWPGLAVAEDHGGQGLGTVELTVVAEELGYALAPTPLASTWAAALLLESALQPPEALRALASGEARGAVAVHDEGAPGWAPVLEPAADGTLTGVKVAVPDAAAADWIVVCGEGSRAWLVAADADGVTVEPARALDHTRRLATVRLEGVDGEPLEGDPERAIQRIAVAAAAESVGVAQRAMDMAVEYAKERKQFGRAIGSYQAVSHACAQMLLEVEGARSVVYYAAWALDHAPDEAPLAAAMAKAYASDAGARVTGAALQVHGGIGFTWEHDLHLFLKRAQANAHSWGDARWHRDRVADLIGL